VVFPEDASMGLTPHRAAKDASLCSRSGLSPAAMSLADVAVVRAQPQLFGPVASDPTVSRLIDPRRRW
jgi:hypothetical protein